MQPSGRLITPVMEIGDLLFERNTRLCLVDSPNPSSEVGTEELGQFISTGTWQNGTFYNFSPHDKLPDLLVEGSEHPGPVVEPGEGLDQAVGEPGLTHRPVPLEL